MFRNTFQSNFLSLFSTAGSDCLELWGVNCDASFVRDPELNSNVLELRKRKDFPSDIKDRFIVCPASPEKTLGTERSLTVSNYQLNTRVRPKICAIPLSMEEGWNIIQIDVADFVRRAYKTGYTETQRVRIHPACRLRRVYFSDRVYNVEDLPREFQLHVPSTPKK